MALAPIARLDHTLSKLFKLGADMKNLIEWVGIDVLGMYRVGGPNWLHE